MNLPVVTKGINKLGSIEYHIQVDQEWDGLDSFVRYLQKHWQVEIIESNDWVYSRRWVLVVQNVPISVYHDSEIGNYFLREDGSNDQALLEEIADDVTRRLGS